MASDLIILITAVLSLLIGALQPVLRIRRLEIGVPRVIVCGVRHLNHLFVRTIANVAVAAGGKKNESKARYVTRHTTALGRTRAGS